MHTLEKWMVIGNKGKKRLKSFEMWCGEKCKRLWPEGKSKKWRHAQENSEKYSKSQIDNWSLKIIEDYEKNVCTDFLMGRNYEQLDRVPRGTPKRIVQFRWNLSLSTFGDHDDVVYAWTAHSRQSTVSDDSPNQRNYILVFLIWML